MCGTPESPFKILHLDLDNRKLRINVLGGDLFVFRFIEHVFFARHVSSEYQLSTVNPNESKIIIKLKGDRHLNCFTCCLLFWSLSFARRGC